MKLKAFFTGLLFFVLSGGAAILLGETWLRVSDETLTAILNRDRDGIYGADSVRVLAIGDSLTSGAPFLKSYPAVLEEMLNEGLSKPRFHVINKGIPGGTSDEILSKLDLNLRMYKPDLVITMLGETDRKLASGSGKMAATGQEARARSFFDNFKTSGIFNLIYLKWYGKYDDFFHGSDLCFMKQLAAAPESKVPEVFFENLMKGENACDLTQYRGKFAMPLLARGDLETAISMHRKVIEKYPKHVMARVELGRALRMSGQVEEALKVHEEAAELQESSDTFSQLAYDFHLLKRYAEEQKVLKEAIHRIAYYQFAEALFANLRALGETKDAEMVRNELASKDNLPLPLHAIVNYREILKRLREQKIPVVVMDYPMRDPRPLRENLKSFSGDVDFVDNQGVFHDLVEKTVYADVFSDDSDEDFGHCTPVGNTLLARQARDAILRKSGITVEGVSPARVIDGH